MRFIFLKGNSFKREEEKTPLIGLPSNAKSPRGSRHILHKVNCEQIL